MLCKHQSELTLYYCVGSSFDSDTQLLLLQQFALHTVMAHLALDEACLLIILSVNTSQEPKFWRCQILIQSSSPCKTSFLFSCYIDFGNIRQPKVLFTLTFTSMVIMLSLVGVQTLWETAMKWNLRRCQSNINHHNGIISN